MDEKIAERIEERIDLYGRIYEKARHAADRLKARDRKDIAARIFGEMARDLRSELISQLRNDGHENENPPATEKQKGALHRFGVRKIPESLSKEEASGILGGLFDLDRRGDGQALEKEVENLNEKWK